MKVLISGICGFVGNSLARYHIEQDSGIEISGFDNFIRAGSETNRRKLQGLGVKVSHAVYVAVNDSHQPELERLCAAIIESLEDLKRRTDGFARPCYTLPAQRIAAY